MNLIGKKFNKLLVIGKIKNTKRKPAWLWACKCDCGKETTAATGHLTRGIKKSCGCLVGKNPNSLNNIKPKFRENHAGWVGYGDISGTNWNRIVRGALLRKHKITVTIEQAWNLFLKQAGLCALSGVKLNFAKTNKELVAGLTTASLDRIDNNKDYTIDNVQWVHKDINYIKHILDEKKLFKWCEIITLYQHEQMASPIEDQETL